jgi:hypothetical protein
VNLHAIVSGAIQVVNPNQPAMIQYSTGYVTNPDGSRSPSYAAATTVSAQVQELRVRDLWHLQGLNLQGSERKIYLYGSVSAIERVSQKGGDLITTQDGKVWLTNAVLEQWDDGANGPAWCAVSVILQNQ